MLSTRVDHAPRAPASGPDHVDRCSSGSSMPDTTTRSLHPDHPRPQPTHSIVAPDHHRPRFDPLDRCPLTTPSPRATHSLAGHMLRARESTPSKLAPAAASRSLDLLARRSAGNFRSQPTRSRAAGPATRLAVRSLAGCRTCIAEMVRPTLALAVRHPMRESDRCEAGRNALADPIRSRERCPVGIGGATRVAACSGKLQRRRRSDRAAVAVRARLTIPRKRDKPTEPDATAGHLRPSQA